MNYREEQCLIAYFSHAGWNYASGEIVDLPIGNTERVANMIRVYTGGNLFHIRTEMVYPNEYRKVVEIAKQQKTNHERPKLKKMVECMEEYTVIFLGYPNWCGTMPMAMWTFLESYDLSGKIIKPFCTHEGSGWGHSLEDIHDICPQARIERGLTLLGTTILDAEDDVRRWLKE